MTKGWCMNECVSVANGSCFSRSKDSTGGSLTCSPRSHGIKSRKQVSVRERSHQPGLTPRTVHKMPSGLFSFSPPVFTRSAYTTVMLGRKSVRKYIRLIDLPLMRRLQTGRMVHAELNRTSAPQRVREKSVLAHCLSF